MLQGPCSSLFQINGATFPSTLTCSTLFYFPSFFLQIISAPNLLLQPAGAVTVISALYHSSMNQKHHHHHHHNLLSVPGMPHRFLPPLQWPLVLPYMWKEASHREACSGPSRSAPTSLFDESGRRRRRRRPSGRGLVLSQTRFSYRVPAWADGTAIIARNLEDAQKPRSFCVLWGYVF